MSSTDDCMKSSAYMAEAVTEPEYALSDGPNKTAFNIAFDTSLSIFEWYEQPDNEERRRTFQAGFESGKIMFNPQQILEGIMIGGSYNNSYPRFTVALGFDWNTNPNGTVVDVGGGVGTQSLVLAQEYPDLNVVVQDLPFVIKDASKVC